MKRKTMQASSEERIRSLLLSDRLGSADGYTDLLTAEAIEMLKKFIEVDKSAVSVRIYRVLGGRYRIEITAETQNVKNLKFV